jgi:predicted dehydrogenase
MLLLAALPVMGQEYKIAIIGLVHSHYGGNLPAIVKNQHVKLVGIAETLPDLIAEAKGRGAKDVPFFDDYKKMLDSAKPDIVWAFVENNRHLEIARECASRKINVIYEKPLAYTYKDAQTIADLAKKSGIKVMCNYQMAWWPANLEAKRQVDAGAIGKPWRLHGIVGHGGKPCPFSFAIPRFE